MRASDESKGTVLALKPCRADSSGAFFIGENAMRVKKIDIAWGISASSGMMGSDIDCEFISKLSDIELLHFNLEVKRALNKCKIEREKRGI